MASRVNVLAVAALMLLFAGVSFAQTQYEVLFSCNMTAQILVGNFDPNSPNDHLYVRGSFNGWGTDNEMSPSFANDSLYEAVVVMDSAVVWDTVAYKYMYTSGAAGDVWESGDNYLFWATGNENDTNGNGLPEIVIPERYFDNLSPDDFFLTEKQVIFQVDMRPAYAFLEDSGSIPFPPGSGNNVTTIDSVYLASGAPNTTPTLAWVWDLPPGDPLLDSLLMNDDGVNGDAVAGDSVFSITITFHVGAPKVIDWKHGVGGPIDNEAGFAQNHHGNVDTPSGRVGVCWGENGDWYDPYLYLCLTGIKAPDVPNVVKDFQLEQNYPNPFNPTTTIRYTLEKAANVKLTIFNSLGQEVRTLVNEKETPGTREVKWDGKDNNGNIVAAGTYFYRLTVNNEFSTTRQMVLVK
ncbi:MAG: T9SS C-terminal target domain-containing protein [Calditrichaeota bacterium]|nr:MAG: T9SS C-terminal target domain-containing protein [Calditrichota bacterium]